MPVQMTEEEKMVGGVFSMRQLGYMLAGFALGGFAAAARLPIVLRFLLYFVIQFSGVALALYQVNHMPLDTFLFHVWRWWRSPRQLYLRGDD